MFEFNAAEGATLGSTLGMWLLVLVALFLANEITRRFKWIGLMSFTLLPIGLSVLWFTVLKEKTYTDWFHLAKVYSATAGCIGFWAIRHLKGMKRKTGREWRFVDSSFAKFFPPFILAINILEAVARDFQVGFQYGGGGILADDGVYVLGGVWNYMNGAAGILNILAITGWVGITIRKRTARDKSLDMLWPDMLWFWIIAYDLWNFTYTYNCLPTHSWYAGLALLIAPTLAAFTVAKGAWLQHRAQTLALWCMFAQTFPLFQDEGKYAVTSTYNATYMMVLGSASLAVNVGVIIYMVYTMITKDGKPYSGELYTHLRKHREVAQLGE